MIGGEISAVFSLSKGMLILLIKIKDYIFLEKLRQWQGYF